MAAFSRAAPELVRRCFTNAKRATSWGGPFARCSETGFGQQIEANLRWVALRKLRIATIAIPKLQKFMC
jgi:hypothetical protein